MIADRMSAAMNAQIREEMDSAYLYLSMAAYFHSIGMDGMAQWMKAQTMEEVGHAMRFFHHLHDRNGKVKLAGLQQPQSEWSSPLAAFRAAHQHEQHITGTINALVNLAIQEKDHAANAMLQWFVTEQVEEEAAAAKICDQLERIGDSGNGLLMLDRELGQRPLPPTVTGETGGA